MSVKLMVDVDVAGTGEERVIDAIMEWCDYYGAKDRDAKIDRAESLAAAYVELKEAEKLAEVALFDLERYTPEMFGPKEDAALKAIRAALAKIEALEAK